MTDRKPPGTHQSCCDSASGPTDLCMTHCLKSEIAAVAA